MEENFFQSGIDSNISKEFRLEEHCLKICKSYKVKIHNSNTIETAAIV